MDNTTTSKPSHYYELTYHPGGSGWLVLLFVRGQEVGGATFEEGEDGYQDATNYGESWLRDLEPPEPGAPKRRRGRPRIHADAAAKQAAYVARKGKAFTVILPPDVAQAFAAYMVRHASDGAGLTQSEVLSKLIAAQLLRKR